MTNPLLAPWTGPFGLPPFEAVRAEHFAPAMQEAMARHLADIEAIAGRTAPPTFENTIVALDGAGRLFGRICSLFYNLTASETSPALQAVEREMAPILAAHDSRVYNNAALFARVDSLHAARDRLGLGDEQRRVLERFHLDFVRAGAQLGPAEQARHAEVMQRLAELTTRFGQNVLADESSFQLRLEGEADLAGLPPFVRAAARQAAAERGLDGAATITLSRSHIVPFLTFSERRDLREKAWLAWTSRGEHPGTSDNRGVAAEILALRLEQARLHGYASFADFALSDTMARSQAAVTALLESVWSPAKARVENERVALAALALSRGESSRIEAWDWRFYAEKVRQVRYELDESEIKPYFPLERMVEAAFDCAARLFGLAFVPRADIGVYHPDVRVYEVRDATGRQIGVFLHDNFARPSKRSGAWMSSYQLQSKNGEGGGPSLPIIVNNNNFAKAAPGQPTLLSFDDARTLFHEFGHGLHGLLSNVTYERLSGTSVLRDFVELPSQIFEHWLEQPEVLKRHARHFESGEPIPDALIARLSEARLFNQGYETVRYAASALVDMAAHACTEGTPDDVVAFERAQWERLGLPDGVGVNHRLTHFGHLFAGSSYAAGYYVYLWAEVLDADGFEAFVEAGNPFDPEVAKRLARFIYSSGNSIEPGAAYQAFRGRGPTAEPMLRRRGLLEPVN
ncbi:MAG: M3 family metallopeptidase [Caldimonas sp.]